MVVWGALQAVATVFNTADASMGLMATINLVAIVALSGTVVKLTRDYFGQRGAGDRAEFPRPRLSRTRRPDRPHDLDAGLSGRLFDGRGGSARLAAGEARRWRMAAAPVDRPDVTGAVVALAGLGFAGRVAEEVARRRRWSRAAGGAAVPRPLPRSPAPAEPDAAALRAAR